MFNENIKFKYSWRPYQAKVLKEVDKYINDGRINVVAAPGSGKTVLGLELARKLSKPVLILSPTVTIKNQWIDRFITLFMPDGSSKPDWISSDVYNLSYFNSITYQGLHCAYKRRIQKVINDTDDEIVQEEFCSDVDIKTYDLIEQIKKNNISTIVLDEAHHLKSEWWQSLTKVMESLENITLISLTATPPYDVEYNEWKKYSELCGPIDIEISVPELVEAKNLCPHQDYIFFSYPTQKEKERIKEYENKLTEFINYLKTNKDFINIIKNHPYIKQTNKYIEEILETPEFYSSMIIVLNSCNVNIDTEKVEILGHKESIPKLTSYWLEILLENMLFVKKDSFENDINILEDIESKLNTIGAIEKKQVLLSKNSSLQKCFTNSISKLESINKIVNEEVKNLKSDLRMVILTDFLRKEFLFEENIEINKIGVFPIFLNLLKQNLNVNIAILTGSIFIVPISKKTELVKYASENGIDESIIDFTNIDNVPNYCIVKTSDKYKNILMNSISKLFSNGDVNIIIGTKSLLGEGWDEPSINSLILASFVGSYVLSNQMRGRAIRTNKNPYKTANVWHLVCVSDVDKTLIENADFDTLKRRFNSFVGIGYSKDVLENGTERLDIDSNKFLKKDIDTYNEKIIKISKNRENMYNRWFELINMYGGSKIKMSEQVETEKENMKNKFSVIQVSKLLRFVLIFGAIEMLMYVNLNIGEDIKTWIISILMTIIISFIMSAILNIKFIIQCIKAIKLSIPKQQLQSVAKVVVKSLCDTNLIKTEYKNIKIRALEQKDDVNVELSIEGVTPHENTIIINSLDEIFSYVESQRYIIVNNKKKVLTYYNVPSILSTRKELAEVYHRNWCKYIGYCELVYTKTVQGRKILIEARRKSFDYTSVDRFTKKKKPISNWS